MCMQTACMTTSTHAWPLWTPHFPSLQLHGDFLQWQEIFICQECAENCYLYEKDAGKFGLLSAFLGRKPLYYKRYLKMELGCCHLNETLWPLVILHYLNITTLNDLLKRGILIMRIRKMMSIDMTRIPWNFWKKNAKWEQIGESFTWIRIGYEHQGILFETPCAEYPSLHSHQPPNFCIALQLVTRNKLQDNHSSPRTSPRWHAKVRNLVSLISKVHVLA